MHYLLPCILRNIFDRRVKKQEKETVQTYIQVEQESFTQDGEKFIESTTIPIPSRARKELEKRVGETISVPIRVYTFKETKKIYHSFHEKQRGVSYTKEDPPSEEIPF
jgi:hypothetical protein